MKVKVCAIDGNRIYEYKGKYDENDHTVEIKKPTGIFTREIKRFLVDPNHIKYMPKKNKIDTVVYVDVRSNKSIPLTDNDPPFDKDLENTLGYLIDEAKWKARRERYKIHWTTAAMMMLAGYGLIRFIEWILTTFMKAY